MKKALSAFLTVLMLLTLLCAFPAAVSAAVTVVAFEEPYIKAVSGQEISLANYSVEFTVSGAAVSDGIVWKDSNGTEITAFKPTEKGVTVLTATANGAQKSVYVVAKNASDTEYVLYEANMADYSSLKSLKDAGWEFKNSDSLYSVSSGKLSIGNVGGDYTRVLLPSWLGDFGNYRIDADISQANQKDTGRWVSIMYRIEKNDYPYYHMCIRNTTSLSNGIEFAERTTANAWNVIITSSSTEVLSSGKHTATVCAKDGTVAYMLNGETVTHTTAATAHTMGRIGLTSNYSTLELYSIKVTLMESLPEKPVVVTNLVNANHQKSKTQNYVTNIAYLTGKEFNEVSASAAYLPTSVIIDISADSKTEAEIVDYINNAIAINSIPGFKINKEQADTLLAAVKTSGTKDITAVTDDFATAKYIRTKNKMVRTAVDLSAVTAQKFSDSDIAALYDSSRAALNSIILLPTALATQTTVKKIQERGITVWACDKTLSSNSEAIWLLLSGANGVVTNNYPLMSATFTSSNLSDKTLTKTPVLTGHRGNPSVEKENSLSGYATALANGMDIVETDIQLSKDGVVMIMHDDTIDRTTTGSGNLSSLTYQQLRQYRLKESNGTASDEPIPTLEELLKLVKPTGKKIFIELKTASSEPLVKEMARLVKLYDMEDYVSVISFSSTALTLTQKYLNVTTDFLLNAPAATNDTAATVNEFYKQYCNIMSVSSTLGINYGNHTLDYFMAAADRGVTMWMWTFGAAYNNLDKFNTFFLNGVNGLTNNDAEKFSKVIKSINTPDNVIYLDVGEKYTIPLYKESYDGTVSDVTLTTKDAFKVIDNSGVISMGANTVTAKKEGTATVLYGVNCRTYAGAQYMLYAQPITVIVGKPEALTFSTSSPYWVDGETVRGVVEGLAVKPLINAIVNDDCKLYTGDGKEVTDDDIAADLVIKDGFYIEHNDKKYTIKIEQSFVELSSALYSIQDGIITVIAAGTTKEALLAGLTYSGEITVTANEKELANSDLVGTGATFTYGGVEYTIVVKGDVDGNGKRESKDYLMLKRAVLGSFTLSGAYKQAGDINGNGIASADYLMLKRAVLGTYEIK